jgi:uncharacterized membrane protein
MMNDHDALQRAIKLAAISGLRAALGPALVAAAHNRPERQVLAMAAIGELVIDKLPLVPSRATLPMLIPRALAGAWVAKTIMEDEGTDDPWAPVYGAAVAIGTATAAPILRGALRRILGVPDAVLGLAEDYLAITAGSAAVGLSIEDVKQIAGDSVAEMKDRLVPAAAQSIGAGSM